MHVVNIDSQLCAMPIFVFPQQMDYTSICVLLVHCKWSQWQMKVKV